MPHVDDHELLAYLDGELSSDRAAEIERHLAECETCSVTREALAFASRRFAAALERIDRPPPAPGLAAILERGKSRGKRLVPRGTLFRAAVLLLTIAGASAAAIPGSPVRQWIARSLAAAGAWFAGEETGAEASGVRPPAAQQVPGVAVRPLEGRVRINLLDPAPEALVRVALTDADEASVHAGGSHYRTGPGWIEVVQGGPGEIRIELPRSVGLAQVEVDGRLAVLKQGADLKLVVPAADSTGSELLFRVNR